jgi:hypothetical protein
VIKPATGAADAMSNACGFSLDGQMAFEVAGPRRDAAVDLALHAEQRQRERARQDFHGSRRPDHRAGGHHR